MFVRRALPWMLAALAATASAGAAERPLRVAAASGATLGEWSSRVDRLVGSRELARASPATTR